MLCLPQGDTSFRNETSGYFCPKYGDTPNVLYYNDLGTILFHPQETAIKQLFHQNGERERGRGGERGGREREKERERKRGREGDTY